MKKVGFIYDDIFLKHETPPGHPESPERLVKIVETLKKSDIWNQLIHIKPRKADEKDILRVHTLCPWMYFSHFYGEIEGIF